MPFANLSFGHSAKFPTYGISKPIYRRSSGNFTKVQIKMTFTGTPYFYIRASDSAAWEKVTLENNTAKEHTFTTPGTKVQYKLFGLPVRDDITYVYIEDLSTS